MNEWGIFYKINPTQRQSLIIIKKNISTKKYPTNNIKLFNRWVHKKYSSHLKLYIKLQKKGAASQHYFQPITDFPDENDPTPTNITSPFHAL